MANMAVVNFVKIAWYGKHFGEEPPLVGRPSASSAGSLPASSGRILAQAQKCGAGTIFFTGCNLRCVYCQNYQISQQGLGKKYSLAELADIMLELEADGAVNIDLVSPTIWAEQIKQAIKLARQQGLKLPIVWNSNAYESVEMIKSLAGIVDIYLPDFKYADNALALKYSGVKNYAATAQAAIKEMFKQVGNLRLSKSGLAKKGLLIRHLVLPSCLANSLKVLEEIKAIDGNIRVSLMGQYEPVFKAKEFSEINHPVRLAEYEKVLDHLCELGLDKGWTQELEESPSVFLPDFRKEEPFEFCHPRESGDPESVSVLPNSGFPAYR